MRRSDFAAAWAVSDAIPAARATATRDDPRLPYHLRWVWDGRPFAGQRVVVRCYHGLGDTLQFCRYLAPLRQQAAHLTLEAQPELVPLLRQLPGVDVIHPFDPAAPLPPGECDVEIMELAHALRLVPDPAPYLWAEPLSGMSGHVGLCWAAGGWDPGRTMPAAALRPLARTLRGISLQRGDAAEQAASLGLTDPLAGSMDLLQLARLVAGLDAVVTVDTMVAHLAGALGRPVHVLLKHEADWRWGSGPRCAWYNSTRLFRQTCPGDWSGPLRELSFCPTMRDCSTEMEQNPPPCLD